MGYVIDTKHHCFAKRMAMVTAEKDKGTSWFKRENWEKACMHWTRAVCLSTSLRLLPVLLHCCCCCSFAAAPLLLLLLC